MRRSTDRHVATPEMLLQMIKIDQSIGTPDIALVIPKKDGQGSVIHFKQGCREVADMNTTMGRGSASVSFLRGNMRRSGRG